MGGNGLGLAPWDLPPSIWESHLTEWGLGAGKGSATRGERKRQRSRSGWPAENLTSAGFWLRGGFQPETEEVPVAEGPAGAGWWEVPDLRLSAHCPGHLPLRCRCSFREVLPWTVESP